MKELKIPEHLIQGCLEQLPEAQEAVYKLVYVEFMKTSIRYAGNYDDAANIVQDAFIKIFTRIDSFNEKGSFEGWMKRIVINEAIDFVRKQKQFPRVELHEKHAYTESGEESALFMIDEARLLELIRQLPKMQLLVFNLYVIDDCSHNEIAKRLHISVAASKWHLFEARRILKNKLKSLIHGQE